MIGLEDIYRRPAVTRRPPSLRRARITSLAPLQVTLDGETSTLDVAETAPAGLVVGDLVQVAFVGRKLTIQSAL